MILLEATAMSWTCDSLQGWCIAESWIELFGYYVGAIFYSLLISNISSILLSMNIAGRVYQEKIQQVNEYMRSKKLPPDLRDKVREFYHLQFAEGKMFDEDVIMKELTPTIRKEILEFNARELLIKVPLLSKSPKHLQQHLAADLQPLVAFEDEAVCTEDMTGTEIYFIYSGLMSVMSNKSSNDQGVITVISDGCYFGEVSILLDRKRCATVKAKSVTVLYSVSGERLLAVLEDYQTVKEHMCKVAERRLGRTLDPEAHGNDVDIEDSQTEMYKQLAAASGPASATGASRTL